jgi:hypothetical protein
LDWNNLQGLTEKFKEKDTAYSGSATFTPDEVCSWPAILRLLIDVLMFSGTFFLDLRMVGECSSASLMWLY